MNKIYIVFNAISRKPVFITDNTDCIKNFELVKEIEIEGNEFNLARFKWDGSYDNGQLVDLFKEKKAIVTENEIDMKYYGMFFRKYSVEQALFNLIDSIQFSNELCEGFRMQQFLKLLLNKKQKEIQMYMESPNHIYETTQDQLNRIEDSFKID